MKLLRRNIWLLFFISFIATLVLLLVLAYSRWLGIQEHYGMRQLNLVEQWFGNLTAILVQQETIIDAVGQDIHHSDAVHGADVQQKLDRLFSLSPGFFAGFALTTPEGDLHKFSHNLKDAQVPKNLLQNELTRDSFQQALDSDSMVLGRTYNVPGVGVVMPARKAIRDDQGAIVDVMTAAIQLDNAGIFFTRGMTLGDFNRITLIRSRDLYPLYSVGDNADKEFYRSAVNKNEFDRLINQLAGNAGLSREALMQSEKAIPYRRYVTDGRDRVYGVAMYQPRYEFWVMSEISEHFYRNELYTTLLSYLSIFLIFQGVMFYLFRLIARTESKRRADLLRQATHDELTGLPNRSYLMQTISEWVYRGQPFSLLFLDMDNFKGVNDNFGHRAGDRVLAELARRLQCRSHDTETPVRLAGDEFLILTPETDEEKLYQRAAGFLAQLKNDFIVGNLHFRLGASIGIARFPDDGDSLESLLRAADIAMYQAKKRKSSIQLFEPFFQEQYLSKLRIEQKLHHAIEQNEFFMVYQPQLDALGRLIGVEALLRWENSELGNVPPDQFIPVAEMSGLMADIGRFVSARALQEISRLQQDSGSRFRVSLNVSVSQFMTPDFLPDLLQQIDAAGLDHALVSLEITENLFIEDMDYVCALLGEVHEQGIHLSLDDFGTGYSSLSVLRCLPLDELKIDKSFVEHLTTDETASKLVQSIISIGSNHHLQVVAEGVETAEQLALLLDCGCQSFQGYHFARPLKIADLRDYLKDQRFL